MKNLDTIRKIYEKYISSTASPDEEAVLHHFFANATDDDIREVIVPYLEDDHKDQDLSPLDSDVTRIFRQIRKKTRPAPKRSYWIGYAAAAILIAILGTTFLMHSSRNNRPQIVTDLSPGIYSATLTLGDGRHISLSDAQNGRIATQDDIAISKNANGDLVYTGNNSSSLTNELSTQRGQTFNLILPDGTKVWLNAASSITYPASFAGLPERKIQLTGEAYFEVSHNVKQPFIVHTDQQDVKVLGTKFNINSYADEGHITTTLAEGAVRITALPTQQTKVLRPGNEILNTSGDLYERVADMETALGWKEGKLYFRDATIKEVLKQISRWYNIDIDYDAIKSSDLFTGGVKRTANLSELLKILELSDVHCMITKIDGTNTLTIKNK